MQTFVQDLRYAWRSLLATRGFATVAVLTLAIGIGANTAIFSIIDTLLLRPLPYRNPEQLVRLNETESAPGRYPFAGPDFVDWKAQNSTFQDMALYGWAGAVNLSGQGQPEQVRAVPTDANFFSLLGVNPILGRTWMAGEDQPGKNQLAVLSYGMWRSHFAGDPGVVGRTIELDSKKHTIVGVMPASFRYPSAAQLWTPMDLSFKWQKERGNHWANAIGRLKPGVSLNKAQADLALIAARLEKQYPDTNYKVGAATRLLHDDLVGGSRDSLMMMLGAVGLVLLIACANVANLLLSRAVARQKEMALRSALGAARIRLVRQLLTESVLLSSLGGLFGLALAWGIIRGFVGMKVSGLPQFNTVQMNGTLLLFTFALAVTTGVLFGIVPALQTSRPDLHEELKGGAGSSISPGRRRRFASRALVVGEIALSLLLLVAAGLLLKDFARLRNTNIGVRTEGVWTAAVRLPKARYDTDHQQFDFSQKLREQAARIPGVKTAAITDHLPLEGGSNFYAKIRGRVTANMSGPLVERHAVSPEYFSAMGIRLLRGRLLNAADVELARAAEDRMNKMFESNPHPAADVTNALVFPSVINESMARTFWPDQSPIGQMFSPGSDNGPWLQVIGVVSDVREWGLTEKTVPESYFAFTGESGLFLVVHTSMPPSSLAAQVRRAVAQLDSSLPLYSVRTMDEVIAEGAQGSQFLSGLVGSFAALAMLLAAVGIYGVLSYAVTQRTREIGIRIALGASRARVLGDVLGEGMILAAWGVAVGIAGALATGRVLASLLHNVQPGDPAILLATAVFLTAVAMMACYLPARRAARLDPMRALRHE